MYPSHPAMMRGRRDADPFDSLPAPIQEHYTSGRFAPIRRSPEQPEDSSDSERMYEVRIMDNDHNTYEEVIQISMLALAIPFEEAYAVAWEVDHRGSCAVAIGPKSDADNIADIIRTIGIEVQVNPMPRNGV